MSTIKVTNLRQENSTVDTIALQTNGSAVLAGTVSSTERAIGVSDFDLSTGNVWTCDAIAVPNPTNAVAGTSGLIRATAAPISFAANFKLPGGSYTAPTTFPAIIPFFVQDSSTILLGNWTEGIT